MLVRVILFIRRLLMSANYALEVCHGSGRIELEMFFIFVATALATGSDIGITIEHYSP